MSSDPNQQTLENRWLDYVKSFGDETARMPMSVVRFSFYAGAASAYRMVATGNSMQLERDIESFIAVEQSDIEAEDRHAKTK